MSASQRARLNPPEINGYDPGPEPGILNEQVLQLVFEHMKWDLPTLCSAARVNRKLRAVAKRILWRELCLYRAPRMVSALAHGLPGTRIAGGWPALAKLLFFCPGSPHHHHIGPGQVGTTDRAGSGHNGPVQVGTGSTAPGDAVNLVGMVRESNHVGTGNLEPGQVGTGNIGTGNIVRDSNHVGAGHIGPGSNGPGQIGPGQTGLGLSGHFVKESRFSKTSGQSFLARGCKGDLLYVSDPCEHALVGRVEGRDEDLGVYRGVFRGFMRSKTRAALIGRQVKLEERVRCPYCGARLWSMTAARMVPKSAARRLGTYDGGLEYFVCINGHLHGTCWLVPLSSDEDKGEYDDLDDDDHDHDDGSDNGHDHDRDDDRSDGRWTFNNGGGETSSRVGDDLCCH